MRNPEQRLFTPGDGATPPALTGREREEAVLSRCLADLLGGRSPPHNVALTGPRGTGKTVLLNWFKRTCREREPEVDVVNLRISRPIGRAANQHGDRHVDRSAAVQWYQQGRISQEWAARIAGMDRTDFILTLSHMGKDSFRVDFDDLDRELSRG